MFQRILIIAIVSLLLVELGYSQDWKTRLGSAKSEEQIRSFYSKFTEFGASHEANYTSGKTKFYLYWIQAEDRATPVFLWAYVFDGDRWRLSVDHPEKGVYADAKIVIVPTEATIQLVNASGEVIKTYMMSH